MTSKRFYLKTYIGKCMESAKRVNIDFEEETMTVIFTKIGQKIKNAKLLSMTFYIVRLRLGSARPELARPDD
jgi:hypothetical protein